MKTVEGKVVILGSQGVGKTSLVVRYVGKMFSQNISPTIGASFFTCKMNVEDTRVKLQIWDTAGQERFRSMAPMYYRNANAAILVFDITQYYSFRCIKSWVNELQSNVNEPMMLYLVGNKCDLESDRNVSKEEAIKFAQSIKAVYYETSAMFGVGVDDLFMNTAVGLTYLSKDPLAVSLRVHDSTANATYGDPIIHARDDLVQAESARSPLCC